MNNFPLRCISICAALLSSVVSAAGYQPPRLSDGKPDLQGVWTNASATPFERDSQLGDRRSYTDAEAAAITKEALGKVAADAAPSDPNAKQEAGALPPVGNYNLFWTDRGMSAAYINGEYRTSMIIDPPNGRVPSLTKEALQKRADMRRAVRSSSADGPEQRGLGERCILSFGSTGGPPMLPAMYNSYYQIVQTPEYVVILVEMVHDARVVRIGGKHQPDSLKKWMGDSVGHWEGDTLVVKTKNFRPEQNFRGTSENAIITERFTRIAKGQILYRFTIEDPDTFTRPFTAELPFDAVDANVYEYACHEGNYSLPGILAAEREQEKANAVKGK